MFEKFEEFKRSFGEALDKIVGAIGASLLPQSTGGMGDAEYLLAFDEASGGGVQLRNIPTCSPLVHIPIDDHYIARLYPFRLSRARPAGDPPGGSSVPPRRGARQLRLRRGPRRPPRPVRRHPTRLRPPHTPSPDLRALDKRARGVRPRGWLQSRRCRGLGSSGGPGPPRS